MGWKSRAATSELRVECTKAFHQSRRGCWAGGSLHAWAGCCRVRSFATSHNRQKITHTHAHTHTNRRPDSRLVLLLLQWSALAVLAEGPKELVNNSRVCVCWCVRLRACACVGVCVCVVLCACFGVLVHVHVVECTITKLLVLPYALTTGTFSNDNKRDDSLEEGRVRG
jgi:hypothetical protein